MRAEAPLWIIKVVLRVLLGVVLIWLMVLLLVAKLEVNNTDKVQ